MADDDLSYLLDGDYTPELNLEPPPPDESLEDKTVQEEIEKKKEREAKAAAAALKPVKSKAEEERERTATAAAKKLDYEKMANMTKAEMEAHQKKEELELAKESLGGGGARSLHAGYAEMWSKDIVITDTSDIRMLGIAIGNSVHKVSPLPRLNSVGATTILPLHYSFLSPPLPFQAFATSPKDTIDFYTEIIGVAEDKLTTAELSLIMKRIQLAVNKAKEREMEQKKKAQPAKKSLPKAKMGSFRDDIDEEDVYAAYGDGGEAEGGGKFTRTTYNAESEFM